MDYGSKKYKGIGVKNYEKRNYEEKVKWFTMWNKKNSRWCWWLLEKIIEEYKNKLDSNKMDASDGGTLGFRRAILEDDNLANIDSLYNAAVAVDKFYSQECREW